MTYALYALASSAVQAAEYTITDIGAFERCVDQVSGAAAINNSGQVAGKSICFGNDRAFIWDAAHGIQDLGDLPGRFSKSVANGLNDLGQVVGYSDTDNTLFRPFLWDSATGMRDIGDAEVLNSRDFALDVNEVGQVVGWSGQDEGNHAFLWDDVNGLRDLNDLSAPNGMESAWAINNLGQVVGQTNPANGNRAYLWDAVNGMQLLSGLPDEGSSRGTDINELGQIVGFASDAEGHVEGAFLWNVANGITELGELPGELDNPAANAINDLGMIVGDTFSDDGFLSPTPFVWDAKRGLRNIGELCDAAAIGWTLWTATDINNRGQIVGFGVNPAGLNRGFVLTPVPEPNSAALLACALATVSSILICFPATAIRTVTSTS